MLLGFLTGFLGSLFGWQINLTAIQRGLLRGKAAAFLVGCGAMIADMMFLWLGFTGAQPLVDHPEWWRWIRWIGIFVLISLAIRVLIVERQLRFQDEEVKKRNPTKNFLVGFLVVGTNPAVFLIWLGVIGFLYSEFEQTLKPWFKEFFLVGFFLGALSWFFLLAFVFLKKLEKWTQKNHALLSRLSVAVLLLVAAYLVFDPN